MRLLISGVFVFIGSSMLIDMLGNEDHDWVGVGFMVILTVVAFLFFVRELLRMLEIGQDSSDSGGSENDGNEWRFSTPVLRGWWGDDGSGNENGGNGGWGGDDGGGGGNGGGGNGD